LPFCIARIFPTAIFGRRHGREKYSVSGLITFDIINYTFMALDALMGMTLQPRRMLILKYLMATLCLQLRIWLLDNIASRSADNIRAAIQHRMNKPENDRLPDILYWKGIQYEMVLPRIST